MEVVQKLVQAVKRYDGPRFLRMDRNCTEVMKSARIIDGHAPHAAWEEKEETNVEACRSDETVVQVKSMRSGENVRGNSSLGATESLVGQTDGTARDAAIRIWLLRK